MDILKNRYNIFCILIVVMKSMCSCNSQDEQIKQLIKYTYIHNNILYINY